ncbi:MAG TPA: hypothetical protein PLQ21_09610 [Candidatus Kapabacteria bacterium]|nr:hypothetical protein [Candidatus Kapabacteria bacterium]
MHAQIQFIAQLAEIDEQMDEFHQELGDLPGEVKDAEKNYVRKTL